MFDNVYEQEGHETYTMKDYLEFEENMKLYGDTKDAVVRRVLTKFKDRSDVGYKKYGTTLERKDIDILGWLDHLQEELMDASLYIEKLKEELEELI